MLEAIPPTKKTGQEKFFTGDKKLPIDVLCFWQWSSSDLLGNTLRGVLAEFIVASAIDDLEKPREEWAAYDLETKCGLKIEVKSSSYLQSWEQPKPSKISFDIPPTTLLEITDAPQESKRHADIYVFCVLAHKEKSTVNPLDLAQWEFYVLDTGVLNEKMPQQKTITLGSLLKLGPAKARYDELGNEIRKRETLYPDKTRSPR